MVDFLRTLESEIHRAVTDIVIELSNCTMSFSILFDETWLAVGILFIRISGIKLDLVVLFCKLAECTPI